MAMSPTPGGAVLSPGMTIGTKVTFAIGRGRGQGRITAINGDPETGALARAGDVVTVTGENRHPRRVPRFVPAAGGTAATFETGGTYEVRKRAEALEAA